MGARRDACWFNCKLVGQGSSWERERLLLPPRETARNGGEDAPDLVPATLAL